MTDAKSTGNAAFVTAADEANNLPKKPTNDELLELYALYKQSIFGDNETAKPGVFDIQGKYKWEAWNKKKGISKEEAQASYIAYVENIKAADE